MGEQECYNIQYLKQSMWKALPAPRFLSGWYEVSVVEELARTGLPSTRKYHGGRETDRIDSPVFRNGMTPFGNKAPYLP